MASKFENTLAILEKQEQLYREQRELTRNVAGDLRQALVSLEGIPKWMKFEVHFQCFAPQHYSVTTEGDLLSDAYDRAVVLWKKLNPDSRGQGSADVFVRVNDLLVIVSPVDAAQIAKEETGREFSPDQFNYDKRLVEKVGTTVWLKSQQLPGWHSKDVTPELDAEPIEANAS